MKDENGFAMSSDFMLNAEIGSPDAPSGRAIGSDDGIGGVDIREARQAANPMR
jgi:hypothetical protein